MSESLTLECYSCSPRFVPRAKLTSLPANLGEKLSDAEISEMIREADKDGDGMVS